LEITINMKAFCSALFVALAAALALSTSAFGQSREEIRLTTATRVLQDLQQSPDQNAPTWLLERAYAVAVVPDVIKVGLGVGARHGNGVLAVRDAKGHWTNPVFIRLSGGSFGLQVGVQATDVLLVFTSRQGVDGIVGGKVTLGADASVAAGPVGRQTSAGTDIGFTAQVYAYSRSKGLFAGIALDGSALTIDRGANARYYQRPNVLASELIAPNAPKPPASGQQFIAELNRILGIGSAAGAAGAATSNSSPANGSAPSGSTTTSVPADPAQLTTRPMEDQNPGTEPPP
jgi:lipid-binding SYLF domain-containing protein